MADLIFRHAAVTNCHIASVKKFVEFMVLIKVFVYQVAKMSIPFCCYVFTKGWIKPNDVPLSLFVCLLPLLSLTSLLLIKLSLSL